MKEPLLLWLTDIWHPNIDHTEPRHVCTNAVQTFFSGKPVAEMVLSLAEMLQYKRYHAKLEPPFPLDLEAARWVREVAEPKGWLGPEKPIDDRPLLRQLQIAKAAAGQDGGGNGGAASSGSPKSGIRIGVRRSPEPDPVTPAPRIGIRIGQPRGN